MVSAAPMRTSMKACGKQHALRIKKAYRKATRAVLKGACHEWSTQKVILNCKHDTYVTSQLPLNMTTWGSNGWYCGPCCFKIFFTQRLPAVSRSICIKVMCLSWYTMFYDTCCADFWFRLRHNSTIGFSPWFVAKLPRDLSTRIRNTQWRTQEFFRGGRFNKLSWGQRTERTGIWGW